MVNAQPEKPTMLQFALEYLRDGLPIFPICSPLMVGHRHKDPDTGETVTCAGDRLGKTPLIKWGRYQHELPTEDDIFYWWDRWPNANIGMATGSLSGSLVLDADGTEARKSCIQLGGLNTTPTVWTGKIGGAHFHLKYPGGDVRNFARKLPGTDMRGQGGYVLLPPSLHASGNSYRWVENTRTLPLAATPDWLLQLIEEGNAIASDMASGRTFDLDDVLRGVKQGERDDKLFRYACSLRHHDVPQDEAEALLAEAARLCDPAFPGATAIGKVRRAYATYKPAVGPAVDFDQEIVPTKAQHESAPDPATFVFARPITELLAEPEEDPDWMVDQLFTVGSNGWIGAEPKVGKSWAGLELVYCLSTGSPFLGRFAVKQKRKVLYIQEEDSKGRVRRRLGQLIRGDPTRPVPEGEYFRYVIRSGFKLDDLSWLAYLRNELSSFGPEVVLLDVFNRFHTKNENNQQEMSEILRVLTSLTKEFGCAFIVVHHDRKPQEGNGARGNQRLRGSGVLGSWGECSLYLKKGKEKDSVEVTPESKDTGDMEEFKFTIEDQPNGGVILQIGEIDRAARLTKVEAQTIEAVKTIRGRGEPPTVMALSKLLDKGRTTVQGTLTKLVRDGYLTATAISSSHNPTMIYDVVTQ